MDKSPYVVLGGAEPNSIDLYYLMGAGKKPLLIVVDKSLGDYYTIVNSYPKNLPS